MQSKRFYKKQNQNKGYEQTSKQDVLTTQNQHIHSLSSKVEALNLKLRQWTSSGK